MIDGFETAGFDTGTAQIFYCHGGTGPPLLLLHGFPETHLMWHRLAPALARDFTVICPDLRGYGTSSCPPSAPDHAPYSKRALAGDMLALMQQRGFTRFAVVGHDRGGRVAYRLALDHPARVSRLAVLDVLPTATVWELGDGRMAQGFWPWSLLAQDPPLPEAVLTRCAAEIVDAALTGWGSAPSSFPPAQREAYIAQLRDAAHARAICEEYRAAATLDVSHDRSDRAGGRRIVCPLLCLWAKDGPLDSWYADHGGPLALWRDWATDVQGEAMPGGHFFPEAEPDRTLNSLRGFLRAA
ncbi:alpha/beta fold hydrolase [Ferrovibrio sp.]|uniref:alpha/beta fold hydrolase n=1 Tax=Ferrovibrio sp. TaxID=1917215 RepID=UPI000CB837D5|nr:alpha/beta hydrolase [Ferrovibrio sp.]PJI42108.1 MAG: alpha/beta hydrolase [Ferrovibrio sp.]